MNTEATEKQTAKNGTRDERGRFAPGNPGGPGRPSGEPNKVGGEVKGDILAAYAERGGIDWLGGLADGLFVRLLEKVMPRQIAADIRAVSRIEVAQAGTDRLDQETAERLGLWLSRYDGTDLMDKMEAAMNTGDLATVATKMSLLEDVIAEKQEQMDEASAQLGRAKAIQARYAEKSGPTPTPGPGLCLPPGE